MSREDIATSEPDTQETAAHTVTLKDLEVVLEHMPEQRRYIARVGSTQVGLAAYLDRGVDRGFHHTETDPAFGGRGIAGALTRFALDDTVAHGRRILPVCSYVRDFVSKHDDWDAHLA